MNRISRSPSPSRRESMSPTQGGTATAGGPGLNSSADAPFPRAPRDIIDNIPINMFRDAAHQTAAFDGCTAEGTVNDDDEEEGGSAVSEEKIAGGRRGEAEMQQQPDDEDDDEDEQDKKKEEAAAEVNKLIEAVSKSLAMEKNKERALDPITVTPPQPTEM